MASWRAFWALILMILAVAVLEGRVVHAGAARLHLGKPHVTVNARRLLQTPCDPSSAKPNTCYNAQGNAFTCCAGSCPSTPGSTPFCTGSDPTNPTPNPVFNPVPTPVPNPAPNTVPNPTPNPAPSTGPSATPAPPVVTPSPSAANLPPNPISGQGPFTSSSGVNCNSDYPAFPNYCFSADGGQYVCCRAPCTGIPPSIAACTGPDNAGTSPPVTPTPNPTQNPPKPTPTLTPTTTPIPTPTPTATPTLTATPSLTPTPTPTSKAGSQSGTGPASPYTPQTASIGAGSINGKSISNNFFYLPAPYASSAGGSSASCTGLGFTNPGPITTSGVDDTKVFFASLEHTTACGDGAQWRIRIGTGGQIYSISSTSNGFDGTELIGPSSSPSNAFTDRVVQTVLFNTELQGVACSGASSGTCKYEVHQGGGAGPNPDGSSPPELAVLLASQYGPNGVALLSWPRQEQFGVEFESGDARFRSKVLMQTHLRDVGQGVLEVSWIIVNHGSVLIDYVDLPWGAFQYDPYFTAYALSVPTQTISPDAGCPGGCQFLDHGHCNPNDPDSFDGVVCWDKVYPGQGEGVAGLFNCETQTNGWMAFASANSSTAPALGVMFAPRAPVDGGDPNFECEVRFGRFVDPGPTYGNVLETIKRPDGILPNGGTIEFRMYLTLGASLASVSTQASRVQQYIAENSLTYGTASASLIAVQTKVPPTVSFSNLNWYSLDKPTSGAAPLIIARHNPTGKVVITTSQYVFSCCAPASATSSSCVSISPCVAPTSVTSYLGFAGWAICNGSPTAGLGTVRLLSSILGSGEFLDPGHPDMDVRNDVYVVIG